MERFFRNIVLTAAGLAAAGAVTLTTAFGDEPTKKMDGKALVEQKCLKCHKLKKFKEQASDRKGWVLTLNRMQRGICTISDDEIEVLADYLAKEYGE